MSLGGLTGAGGGSIAGTAPPPSQKQPGISDLISYAQSGPAKTDGGKQSAGSDKFDRGTPTSNDSGLDVPTEKQSQELRAFDAMQGRPRLGDERHGDGQKGSENREGSFVGCAAGAAKDAVVDTVKGTYETVKDAGGVVLDAGGAVLDKVFRIDGFEDQAERTGERVDAAKDGVAKTLEAAKSPIETGGKIYEGGKDKLGELYEAGKDELAEIGEEIKNGDSCAIGERVGTTVGVGATVAVPGIAVIKGGKVLAKIGGKDGSDGPDAKGKTETNDAGKADNDKRIAEGSVEYRVTTDKPGWGETRREVDDFREAKSRRSESGDPGIRGEATALDDLEGHGINIDDRGMDIEELGRKEMRPPPDEHEILGEIDIETKDFIVDVHTGKKGKREQVERQLNHEQLNRGKDVILYSPNYSKHGTEFVDGMEVVKDAFGPNGERARVVRDAGELAEIVKSSR